jgi:hypothetical protein
VESEEARRRLIKTAVRIEKRNGTPWAIRQIFRSLDLGEITLIEDVDNVHYDSTACYDGTFYQPCRKTPFLRTKIQGKDCEAIQTPQIHRASIEWEKREDPG